MNYPKDAMARANLYVIQRKADMMIEMMPRGQEPPPWIEDNLATARTLMQQVCSYYLWLNNDAEAQQLSQQMDMEDMQAMLPAMQAMVPPEMPTSQEQQMAAQMGGWHAYGNNCPGLPTNRMAIQYPQVAPTAWDFPPLFTRMAGW
jgi:hypothetical protein